MKVTHPVSRRTLLRCAGATLCLPLMESLLPKSAKAADTPPKPPQRMIFLSYSWGVSKEDWFPKEHGEDYELSECLQPLARHKADFSVLSNLSNKLATQGHWGCTTWLTSADVNSTPGKQFQNWVSVDQLAARKLGIETRFPSLELAGSNKEDGYGPGLSLSWSMSGSPIAGETSPIALFDRLFGAEEVPLEERQYLLNKQKSVLDAVMSDARSLRPSLSKNDQQKVEQYFQSVRDIEVRLSKAEQWLDRPKPPAPFKRPDGKFQTSEEIKLMYDLMVAAIETDMTRVITYRQPVEGLFPELGFKVNGHSTTHCTTESESYKASIARDRKQAELLAHLIDRLKELKDLDGSSVLDNSLIAYGSGIRTNHDLRDTPVLVAGHGGGGMQQGHHYVYESNQTPLANLWLSMLNQVGVEADTFADSEGRLRHLFG
ncbi:DUF1552 domain-containing protein [Bremerella sp.]|uniref:DUF1552 domain-containing protein n=1 Tax=Bremerella sp. TaxID=2795602 RepID=UPI003918F596